MRHIETAAKHAVPVIKERMVIVDTAEEKGIEPNLPVSLKLFQCHIDGKLTTNKERHAQRHHRRRKTRQQHVSRIRPPGNRSQDDGPQLRPILHKPSNHDQPNLRPNFSPPRRFRDHDHRPTRRNRHGNEQRR